MNHPMEAFEVKRLGKQDITLAREMIKVFQEVFQMEDTTFPKESHLAALLAKPDFIAYVALHENKVKGGLTAYELPMLYSETPEVFIYDVGVQEEFQRRGLGKKLLSALQDYCLQNNRKQIFVAASEED